MNVAFIPVRGGSKSIPLKNIKPLCGKPLVYWAINAACDCSYIDRIYIATDSDEIRSVLDGLHIKFDDKEWDKVYVIDRSEENASDNASTESAMIEFARKYEFDNIALIQATSPLITGKDLDKGFEVFNEPDVDSVLSAVKQKRFNWNVNDKRKAEPLNYDIYNRPRRQDFEGYYVENGAFYITSKYGLLNSGNRISGNIRIVEMPASSFFEIDEKDDWEIIEYILNKKTRRDQSDCFEKHNIKMVLSDCDGCLTDGGMYYSEKGDEIKKFNTRDGVAFSQLKDHGIATGIITGESVELNDRRAKKLKLDYCIRGCVDKTNIIKKISREAGIPMENICYVGDDINDLDVIKLVGIGCCPNDAIQIIKDAADYISTVEGGKGVIRDIADQILGKAYLTGK